MNDIIEIKATNICAIGRHPEDILSNLCGNDFCFDKIQCGCMESFLQSLKVQDQHLQSKICLCKARELAEFLIPDWNGSQSLLWKGKEIDRHSTEYIELFCDAYKAMYLWCARFRTTLMSTVGKQLYFDSGATNPDITILTDAEFIQLLTHLRDTHIEEYTKNRYPRMWPNSYGVEEDYVF